jgi:hypothetical protein
LREEAGLVRLSRIASVSNETNGLARLLGNASFNLLDFEALFANKARREQGCRPIINAALRDSGQNPNAGHGRRPIVNLRKLLQKVESASAGSPELDGDFLSTFPSAPPNVSRSIDAAVQLIESELPG